MSSNDSLKKDKAPKPADEKRKNADDSHVRDGKFPKPNNPKQRDIDEISEDDSQ
jgi:hypothetical protein